MYDYPKLRTPFMFLVLAALLVALTIKAKELPDWVRMFTAFLAVISGTIGVMTLLDWIVYSASERVKDFNEARTYGAVVLANALKGLTSSQTEAILAGEKVAMQLIPGEKEPMLFVRGLVHSIPWAFVEEFLIKSKQTEPYLWPERESGNKNYGTDLTNLIISLGWATKGQGPWAAKLTKPLAWVAERFWVDLGEDTDNETTSEDNTR